MRNQKRRPQRSGCPLNATLEALGDSWSLLIVRDLMFKDACSYRHFLEAGEGIASNILMDRLRRLLAAGIVEKRADPDDGRRTLYRLRTKGIDLAPVLVEMILWGARYYDTDAPAPVLRRMERDREGFLEDLQRHLTQAKCET